MVIFIKVKKYICSFFFNPFNPWVEIHHIGEVKTKAASTKSFVELDFIKDLRDDVIGSAKELIESCNEYRQRHIKKDYLS